MVNPIGGRAPGKMFALRAPRSGSIKLVALRAPRSEFEKRSVRSALRAPVRSALRMKIIYFTN
jgi:hypothetical protein